MLKQNKWLACVCLILVSAILLVGCVSNSDNTNNDNNGSSNGDNEVKDDKVDAKKTELDAFEGLKLTFSGVSPRCTVMIDNSACEQNARSSVVYETDKQFYADKESVIVTAKLTEKAKSSYKLKSDSKSYTVSNVSAYYTASTVAVTDLIKSEIRDVVTAEIAQMGKTNKLFGIGGYSKDWHYSKVDSVISIEAYLLTVKDTKIAEYGTNSAPFYNSLRIVADAVVHTGGNDGNRSGHFYICFILNDVIVAPDGSIKWKNSKDYEITYKAKANDNTVAAENVLVHSVYYNIQELEQKDWIAFNNN
jgi:hypothetical protein